MCEILWRADVIARMVGWGGWEITISCVIFIDKEKGDETFGEYLSITSMCIYGTHLGLSFSGLWLLFSCSCLA